MKTIDNYILEKLSLNKNTASPFFMIMSKLHEYDSPYLENTLHLPGEACIDKFYDKRKEWRIMSIAPNDDDTKLVAELATDEGDEKTVEIDEKTFNKLFTKEDIEEINNTLDES